MENCLGHHSSLSLQFSRSSTGHNLNRNCFPKPTLRFFKNSPCKPLRGSCFYIRRRPIKVIASVGASHCEFSSVNSPLEPKSLVGKFLSSVLQNHRHLFHVAVVEELKLLVDGRDAAVARMLLSSWSDEAVLHRRIALVKEHQCEMVIEDILYLLIFYKFSEMRVPLVPKLSACIYNGRLEILPSKDWELESIHSLEVLNMIREHVTTVTGLRANSSVTESWATTKIRQFLLARIYVASILYGYFLKSVSLRYQLEQSLSVVNHDLHFSHNTALSFHDGSPYGFKDEILGCLSNMQSVGQGLIRQEEELEDLKCYVMSFHPASLQRCAKLRSKEAVSLVESYCYVLFGNGESGLVENDDVILTSYSSLKRLVLEAVAFGSFLWETEDYIDSVYKLKDD